MPISKKNRLYYTAEQYEAARSNSNALEYARRQGYDLVRRGSYYCLREHDSMVFTPEGKWFWNSRQLHGGALEFMMYYEGRSFPEAVLLLAGTSEPGASPPNGQPSTPAPQPKPETEKVPFCLPPRAQNMRRLFGYLCGARKLDYGVVKEMTAQGIVYESIFRSSTGKELHNACFVSYDGLGNPCSAFQRGMTSTVYKGEVPGSSKDWGWVLHGKHPTKLYVFEAAIDAASYVTWQIRQGNDPLLDGDFLALGGLNFTPIERYLERHPHVEHVLLLLDADQPGQAAAQRFQDVLLELGYRVTSLVPPSGKDWNDALCSLAACGK